MDLAAIRIERAIIALADLASREGATAKGVMKALKKDGFTPEEIAKAVKCMEGAENG